MYEDLVVFNYVHYTNFHYSCITRFTWLCMGVTWIHMLSHYILCCLLRVMLTLCVTKALYDIGIMRQEYHYVVE